MLCARSPGAWSVRVLLGLVLALPAVPSASASAETLEQLVARKAAALGILHTKARRALVTAAQDPAFADYLSSHTDGDAHQHPQLRARVEAISLAVQSRFDVEEMCLIAPDGAELSRVVGGRVATELSTDEAGASFFAPGFASPPRRVYVSEAYLSPDAHRWVVAYVTPIPRGGRNAAILHYEIGLDGYQRVLGDGLANDARTLLALDADGYVLADAHRSIPVARIGENEAPADYFERFSIGGADLAAALNAIDRGEPLSDDEGRRYRGAYRRIERWVVLGLARE